MQKRPVFSFLVCLSLLSLMLNIKPIASAGSQYANLTSEESELVTRISGARIYDYDLELEKIALNHSVSAYSFRSSGSVGANATAKWIEGQFESFGLDTHMEPFEFTTWNLPSQPLLMIDLDGNQSTTDDKVVINSFQCEHYSWPTPKEGVFADLVTLPVPEASSRENVGVKPYDAAAWNAVNTTGKILLIGREIRWSSATHLVFRNKLQQQPPAAVIFTYWYDWMSWVPPGFSSSGGRPASEYGAYFWNWHIPTGCVSYGDGLWIRQQAASANVSAFVKVDAEIGSGPHYNVVANLTGSENPDRVIIISGHYDTIMASGFCDNGAGTAGVLELARVFSQAAQEKVYTPKCTLLFIAFAGEELGLVGAVKYMQQHEAELKNIAAVINLDCIGAETFEISETFPDDSGLDLESIVLKAASDLGLATRTIEPGGSDQEAFRNPVDTDDVYYLFWGSQSPIRNMSRVKSSIMIDSYPLFYSDVEEGGKPGWIHTEYDNSTTLNWVTAGRLESHVRVAGLSVLRVMSSIFSPYLLEVYAVTAAVGIVAAVLIYFECSRVRWGLKKVQHEVLSYIGTKELIYIVILTVIFLFIFFSLHLRIGKTEIIDKGYPTVIDAEYFGSPFEMFGMPIPTTTTSMNFMEGLTESATAPGGGIFILWQGLVLNLAIAVSAAFLLTYGIMKIRGRIHYFES